MNVVTLEQFVEAPTRDSALRACFVVADPEDPADAAGHAATLVVTLTLDVRSEPRYRGAFRI